MQVEDLEKSGGNTRDAAMYLAPSKWDSNSNPKPESGQRDKIKRFIEQKYVDKRWFEIPKKEAEKPKEDKKPEVSALLQPLLLSNDAQTSTP